MKPKLGFLITTSDASWHHFPRVLAEFSRLGYPFAVNFDHCGIGTKRLFKAHPLYLGGYEDDDPKSKFDETHKQRPLDILVREGFDWAAYLDTDEVFDRRAPEMIPRILEQDTDVVWCPVIDFWGDDKHYRVDGPLGPCMDVNAADAGNGKQLRDKFYNLQTGNWKYLHADVHAPYFTCKARPRAARRLRWPLYVLHYGLMDLQHMAFKRDQWTRIYTSRLGKMPYKHFYEYLSNPSTAPWVEEFDYDTWEGK